jgi:hypothetical protein
MRSYLNGKVAAPGLENQDKRPWVSVTLTMRHHLSANLALTSPTSGSRSDGIVRLRTKATEFSLVSIAKNVFRKCAPLLGRILSVVLKRDQENDNSHEVLR